MAETSQVPTGPGWKGKFYTISTQIHRMAAWQGYGIQISDLWLRVTSPFIWHISPHRPFQDAAIVRMVVKSESYYCRLLPHVVMGTGQSTAPPCPEPLLQPDLLQGEQTAL